MIPNFPLFEQLYLQSEENKSIESLEINKKIRSLDEEGHEILFLLIYCYYHMIDKGIEEHPYSPKISKLGYRFEIHQLPLRLIDMIEKFILLHQKKIEDERNRFEKK